MRRLLSCLLAIWAGCSVEAPAEAPPEPAAASFAAEREEMVTRTIASRGVKDAAVLAAMRKVPRHEFVPERRRKFSYTDSALPIGHAQTISQPYIVAIMAEVAEIGAKERVLEIGTGSGYGAAVLAEVAAEVYTIEILEPLADRARATLKRLGYENVKVKHGDGYQGWPDAAPFDAIVVTAAPPRVPEPLKQQLKVGGRLVIPVGRHIQYLRVITRTEKGFEEQGLFEVRFVPMTGEVQEKD